MIKTLYKALAPVLLFTMVAAAQSSPDPQADAAEGEKQGTPPRRIVDPASIKRTPIPAEPGNVERGLNYAERTELPRRMAEILAHPNFRPTFGSLGDGSGFGLGFIGSTADKLSPHVSFDVGAHGTFKRYFQGTAGFNFHDRAKAEDRRWELALLGSLRLRPQEDFWGIGPQSPATRTDYDLQERAAGMELQFRPARKLTFGATAAYNSTSVFRGKDDRFPDTHDLIPLVVLPGFTGAEYFTSGASIAFDTRDARTNPSKDFFAEFRFASNADLNSSNLSFWSYRTDVRTYIPLGSPHRVLATRTLLLFNEPKAGAEVPFFRLAQLGNSETLRGFDSQRFYGRHAAAWNAEYRLDLTTGLGAFAFTDFGQVFNHAAEFNRDNFRVTWGGGLSFQTRHSVFLRVYLAKSEEASRLFFSFGPTF